MDATAKATRNLVWVTVVLAVLNGAFIAATLWNQISANNTANRIESKAERATNSRDAAAGVAVASVYLFRVQQEKRGLVDIWSKGRTLEPYLPVDSLNVSVDDGVALQQAKAPPNTLPTIGALYGHLLVAYNLLLRRGGNHRLDGGLRRLICGTLYFADLAEHYLIRIKGVLYNTSEEPFLRKPQYEFATLSRGKRVVHRTSCLSAGRP